MTDSSIDLLPTAAYRHAAESAEIGSRHACDRVTLIDPSAMHPSRWFARHPRVFTEPAFEALKDSILRTSGNLQPIVVRRDLFGYTLVFGHRRQRACLELGLYVWAVVQEAPMSDMDLFDQTVQEYRQDTSLTEWEMSSLLARALDDGPFSTQRRLAAYIDMSPRKVSDLVGMAGLPTSLISAFRDPRQIKRHHSAQLTAALDRDPAGVAARAAQICADTGADLTAAEVVHRLVGLPLLEKSKSRRHLSAHADD